jgi:hypothetical protein
VQSDPYSFAFEYREGDRADAGLGMITPQNEGRDHHLPDEIRTRMILYLNENKDPKALCQDLTTLPDTLLLFLKKLKVLTLHLQLQSQPPQMIQYSKEIAGNIARITIRRTGPNPGVTTKVFLVKDRHVTGMPYHAARQNVRGATVVLAFPINEQKTPVVDSQYAFAFLPIIEAGYKVSAVPSHV